MCLLESVYIILSNSKKGYGAIAVSTRNKGAYIHLMFLLLIDREGNEVESKASALGCVQGRIQQWARVRLKPSIASDLWSFIRVFLNLECI